MARKYGGGGNDGGVPHEKWEASSEEMLAGERDLIGAISTVERRRGSPRDVRNVLGPSWKNSGWWRRGLRAGGSLWGAVA